jgi:hypothetical protein
VGDPPRRRRRRVRARREASPRSSGPPDRATTPCSRRSKVHARQEGCRAGEPYAPCREQGMPMVRRRDDVSPPGRRLRRETTRGAGPVEAHAAQLHRQMDATRTRREPRVSQRPAGLLERQALGPVRGGQETAARATTWLPRRSGRAALPSRIPALVASGWPTEQSAPAYVPPPASGAPPDLALRPKRSVVRATLWTHHQSSRSHEPVVWEGARWQRHGSTGAGPRAGLGAPFGARIRPRRPRPAAGRARRHAPPRPCRRMRAAVSASPRRTARLSGRHAWRR